MRKRNSSRPLSPWGSRGTGEFAPSPAAAQGLAALAVLWFSTFPAQANNGLEAPGNGAVQLGLAGAGTALAEDAAATLRNPAAGAWIPSGVVVDLGLVLADGGYQASAPGAGSLMGLFELQPGSNNSVKGLFPVPELALNWRLSERSAVGFGVTAAGLKALTGPTTALLARGIPGVETRCDGELAAGAPVAGSLDPLGLCGRSETTPGFDLEQVFVSAYWAWKPAQDVSIGVAPVIELQQIKLKGLAAFAAFSNFPGEVSDRGYERAGGGGLRLGMLWQITDGVGVGAAYESELYQTTFRHYRGVIPGAALDYPAVIDLGLQVHLSAGHRFVFDIEQVRYGDIKALGYHVDLQTFANDCFVPRLLGRSANPAPLNACLGGPSGPGFGWNTIIVYKFGYQGRDGRLSWRAGYSFGGNPVAKDQVLQATLAPALTDQHVSAGLSWQASPTRTYSCALVYAVRASASGPNALSNAVPAVTGGPLLAGFNLQPGPLDQTLTNHFAVYQIQFEMNWTPEF